MAKQNSRLIYIMDPMCSWCWGFSPVMQQLADQAAQYGVALTLRAGGLRPHVKLGLTEQKAQIILGHWRTVQERTGQPVTLEGALPAGFVYNTEPADRALVVARYLDETKLWDFVQRLQHAFYVDLLDITQAKQILNIAGQAGYSKKHFAEAFDSKAMQQATLEDFEWVGSLGISGFPTLLAEHKGQLALLTNGYQAFSALSGLLDSWLKHNLGKS